MQMIIIAQCMPPTKPGLEKRTAYIPLLVQRRPSGVWDILQRGIGTYGLYVDAEREGVYWAEETGCKFFPNVAMKDEECMIAVPVGMQLGYEQEITIHGPHSDCNLQRN